MQHARNNMKPYKLEIKTIIFLVAVMSIFIFSGVQIALHTEQSKEIGELLLHYGFLIAPITALWVLVDKSLWHSGVMQKVRHALHTPPDIRGRWEGELVSAKNPTPQQFVIEVRQSLTHLTVHAYSSVGHSKSILADITTDEQGEHFTLCFLWQGEVPIVVDGVQMHKKFNGYTMLTLDDTSEPKVLKGNYFTDFVPEQTRGTIELKFTTLSFKKAL
jgi:SMODS-associating 2TM, beta-strand rich effector domain